MAYKILRLLILSTVLAGCTAGDFFSECPRDCQCIWSSGKKQANCSKRDIKLIPSLSSETQTLELSQNPLYEIPMNAFVLKDLVNLKRLVLSDCKIINIQQKGFNGLGILTELDLSNNNLKSLKNDTFEGLKQIRRINLHNNHIEKLEDGLFKDLEHLQKIDLSHNNLMRIGVQTFHALPKLTDLRLNNNNLTHLRVETFVALTSLTSLGLYDNPWKCDCNLQPFRNWAIGKTSNEPVSCVEPEKLNGKTWDVLRSDDFACKPTIIIPTPGYVMRAFDYNATLICKVVGNPLPTVHWLLNTQFIDDSIRKHGEQKYILTESHNDLTKWLNLTILDATSADKGDYSCVASNLGGIDERSMRLIVKTGPGVVGTAGIESEMFSVIIGLICGIVVLLIIAIVACYCYCKKRNEDQKSSQSVNGDALIEGSVIPELEKSFVCAVNPVTKPPRRYEAPSITSAATEMSDLNKTLLDNDSVFASPEDDIRLQEQQHYPPDLLAFPPRAQMVSPNSTYMNPALYRTLPYSRSHSPAPAVPPVISPRKGYVTIPRRPRAPSWASYLPPTDTQEPLYDNLGLRTTADGSSALSLNKAGVENPYSPMRNRPLPAAPMPISEHSFMEAPHLARNKLRMTSTPDKNRMPSTDTLSSQRDYSSVRDDASIGSSSIGRRVSNDTLNQSPVKELNESKRIPEAINRAPSKDQISLLSDTISLPSGTLNRSGKVPPRPPPKPKKKPQVNDSTQPLFEDEGEDGTEV